MTGDLSQHRLSLRLQWPLLNTLYSRPYPPLHLLPLTLRPPFPKGLGVLGGSIPHFSGRLSLSSHTMWM